MTFINKLLGFCYNIYVWTKGENKMALQFSEQNEYQKLVQLIIKYGGGWRRHQQ